MKQLIILATLCCLHIPAAFGQIVESSLYPNGQVEKTYAYFEGRTRAIYTSYYKDIEPRYDGTFPAFGRVKLYGFYHNREMDGKWIEYYPNGQVYEVYTYANGSREGYYASYYEDTVLRSDYSFALHGALKSEGTYRNGKRKGKWKDYYPDGRLRAQVVYRTGIQKVRFYHPNGQLEDIYDRVDYKQEGVYTNYYQDTCPRANGKFAKRGQVKIQAFYRNGNPDGVWRVYYPSGRLKKFITCVDGEKEGLYTSYYEGEKKLPAKSLAQVNEQGNYRNGVKDGEWRMYYSNGQLEERGSFLNGKKNGEWECYSDDGKRKKVETYVDGEVISSFFVECDHT